MSQLSEQAHAAILLRVAAKTVVEARRAWKRVDLGDTDSLRSAHRACVLALQSSRRAAAAWKHDARESKRLAAVTERLVATAADLRDQLAQQEAEVVAAAGHSPRR